MPRLSAAGISHATRKRRSNRNPPSEIFVPPIDSAAGLYRFYLDEVQ